MRSGTEDFDRHKFTMQPIGSSYQTIPELFGSGAISLQILNLKREVRKRLRGRPRSTIISADNRETSMIGASIPIQKLCLNRISHRITRFSTKCDLVPPRQQVPFQQYCELSASNRSYSLLFIYNCIFMLTLENGLGISAIEPPVRTFRRESSCQD
jgi:hypothetical protein